MIDRKVVPPKPLAKKTGTWDMTLEAEPLSMYHGSFDTGGSAPVFKVRTPDPDRCTHGEDVETPRISCASNLLDVIASGYLWSPRNQDTLATELLHSLDIYALTAKSYTIPSLRQVPDAGMSGEVWITDDSGLIQEHCAVVKVTNHYTLQELLGTKNSGWNYLFLDLEIEVLTQMQYSQKTLLPPGKYVVSIMRTIDSDTPWTSDINEPANALCDFITRPPYMHRVFDMVDTIVGTLLEDLMVRTNDDPPAIETNFLVDLNRFSTVALHLVLSDKDKIKATLLLMDFKEFIRAATRNMALCDWHTVVRNRRTYHVLTATGVSDTENKEIPKWESKKGLFQTK